MTNTYKRAYNGTLAATDTVLYTATSGSTQIRAITVFNPTASTVELTMKVGGNQYLKRSVIAGATITISELINQQIEASETIVAAGVDLNLILAVVEITA